MKKKTIIPPKYYHLFPYSYRSLVVESISEQTLPEIRIRTGERINIQNREAEIITFYKNISRL